MPRYIAFLRAINVGGHTVRMDHLRRLFEALGFTNVETFIASGNVIFDSQARSATALEGKIEAHLEAQLGYKVATFIRSPAELAAIGNYKPFDSSALESKGNTLYIAFLPDKPPNEGKKKLSSFISDVDELHVAGREVYWLCRTTFRESNFSGAQLEKTLGMPATLRNANTVRKLAAKYS
ncbi:MAG TPA: DUF1697 domain-containing protein [Pyrinomonadaceae bacterium]|nr:DUF1697 domain-containing protein [Pyrinomonadaceae bacterium]